MAPHEKTPQQALDIDVSRVAGNAPAETKQMLLHTFKSTTSGFVQYIGTRIQVTEVSLTKKEEAPEKVESKVVCELVVDADMVNSSNHMHGGCTAYLVDLCTTFCLVVYNLAIVGQHNFGVSLSLDVLYHAPAPQNDKLRIVSTTMAVGGRTMSARTEIWSTAYNRLVATGVHIKMQPSQQKPKVRL